MKGRHTPEQIVAKLRQAELELAGAGPNSTKLEFGYDYLSRRVERRDYAYTDGQWVLGEHHRFVYDRWNVIEELDATQGGGQPPVIRKYTWGLDLAGQNGAPSVSGMTPQGAGGIGGLLACYDTGGGTTSTSDDRTFLYFFDANGNVGQLIETTGGPGGVNPETPPLPSYGTLAAHYEYDPYGGRLNTPGAGEYAQAYQFSTKRLDPDTGLLYYGHRDLNTRLGRWVSRDWAGETKSPNMYEYARSSPLVYVDPYGDNLYAIDGTWSGVDRRNLPPWAWDLDFGRDTNTHRIYQLTSEPKAYWDGPYLGGTGLDMPINSVWRKICNDYCDAKRNCTEMTVNLVGWSRGAFTALVVAHRLWTDGCDCSQGLFRWFFESERERPIPVNWMGLFDAVDMSPIPQDPHSSDPDLVVVPPNVEHFSHAAKTSFALSELAFPTITSIPAKFFWRHDGNPTTHSDIGRNMINNDAFYWIRSEARAAGVGIR